MNYDRKLNLRTKLRKELFVWAVLLVVMVAIATRGAEQEQNASAFDEVESVMASTAGTDVVIQSLNFKKDVSIRDALRFLAAKYQKNIVPSSKVDGLITVTSLYDVTFTEALSAILGHNFKYEQEGNFIRVYTTEEYKSIKEDKDRMTYKVFTLYYISATEAKRLILPVLSTAGKIESSTAAETGVPTSESISSTSGSGGDDVALNDTLIVFDYPENIAKAEEVINSLDIRPKQVLIEATVLSVTLTDDTQFGIDWRTLKGAVSGVSSITKDTADYVASAGAGQVSKTGGLIFATVAGDVGTFIEAVEEISDVTVLANPKILAVNKQLGQVYIGKKIAYQSQTTVSEGGTSTSEIAFLDTGTKLSFRPFIGNDGYIRLDIHPKDSSPTLRTVGSTTLPDETSAELVTNIIVKDGQTVVIGGLFRDKITSNETKIPLLGDLPVVGAAFKGTADKNERQEVMILLTPHIIEEPQQAKGQDRAEDVSRFRAAAKDALNHIGRTRRAEDGYSQAVKYYLEDNKKAALEELTEVLKLRPGYLEALRLRDKIVGEMEPDDVTAIERGMRSIIEHRDSRMWQRK